MEVELKAGVKLDLLNRAELQNELGVQFGWLAEAARGVRFKSFSNQVTVPAAGTWEMTGDRDGALGPADGFLWAVTRVAVSGSGFDPTANVYAVHVDEATPSRLVVNGLTRGKDWNIGGLVVLGGSELVFRGTGTAASDVVVSGAAIEIPVQFGWRLI